MALEGCTKIANFFEPQLLLVKRAGLLVIHYLLNFITVQLSGQRNHKYSIWHTKLHGFNVLSGDC